MGTRGAFGVIIGEQEKIGYNQFDSYPSGCGVEILQWLRNADLGEVRRLAEAVKVVDDNTPPTPEDVEALKPYTNLGVSEQSIDDWYCLTRETHGSIERMLESGYMLDSSAFPLDSLFCEWAYIVDLDQNSFEVYQGFQHARPKHGRWAGRPTPDEAKKAYEAHVAWCQENSREPWESETPRYYAVERIAEWPLDALPSDEEFLAIDKQEE